MDCIKLLFGYKIWHLCLLLCSTKEFDDLSMRRNWFQSNTERLSRFESITERLIEHSMRRSGFESNTERLSGFESNTERLCGFEPNRERLRENDLDNLRPGQHRMRMMGYDLNIVRPIVYEQRIV